MNVTYEDRNGKAWRFNVDATPYQTLLFRRVLYAVRNVAQREQLSLSYLAAAEDNDAFLSNVEAVVLAALSERFTATPTPTPPTPPYPTPTPQPPRVLSDPVGQLAAKTEAKADRDPDEREPYYWENF